MQPDTKASGINGLHKQFQIGNGIPPSLRKELSGVNEVRPGYKPGMYASTVARSKSTPYSNAYIATRNKEVGTTLCLLFVYTR